MVKKILKLFLLIAIIAVISASAFNSYNAIEPASTVISNPKEISDVLVNPYMGLVPPARGGPYVQPHSLVFAGVSWRELEEQKGKFNFSDFESENKFEYWKKQGVKIIIRLNMDYPGKSKHMDIPDWLYKEINGDGSWYDTDIGKGFSPNYNNSIIIESHKKLIEVLGKRYSNDSAVALMQIGSLGHWGEFHTRIQYPKPGSFPKVDVANKYVQHYIDNFPNKTLCMRRSYKIAGDNKMGLYNDMFGNHTHTYDWFIDWFKNGYTTLATGDIHPPMPDFWKYAPSGGEFGDYPGIQYLKDSAIDETLKQLRDSHTSWLGFYCPKKYPTGSDYKGNVDRMLKTMGYRFVLKSAMHSYKVLPGSSLDVAMEWENKGVAPFYSKWPLELSLSDSNGKIVASTKTPEDITKWLPGVSSTVQSIKIPENLPTGTYSLCVAILDPGTGNPAINLAIEGKRPDGRYRLQDIKAYLPGPFTFNDVGNPEKKGWAAFNRDVLSISGAGNDIWSKSDQFAYVYRHTQGDSRISVQVLSQKNTDNWAKAGLMFRETLESDSRFVNYFVTPARGLVFQLRSTKGQSCQSITLEKTFKLPTFLKLERRGNTFIAFKSNNSNNWGKPLISRDVVMNSNATVGMSVTSHSPSNPSLVMFRKIMVSPEYVFKKVI